MIEMQSTHQVVNLYEVRINNLTIIRVSKQKAPISPLEAHEAFKKENLELISARDVVYAQNHINNPKIIKKEDGSTLSIKSPKKIILNYTILIKETLIVTPHSYSYPYVFIRESFHFQNLNEMNAQAKDYYLTEEWKAHLKRAEKEQQKPLEERAMLILYPSALIIPLIKGRESTDLAKWLFQDKLGFLHACLEKHRTREFFFYGVETQDRDQNLPSIRGLWLSPINDERDPPEKDRPSIGSYRLGNDHFYTSPKKSA